MSTGARSHVLVLGDRSSRLGCPRAFASRLVNHPSQQQQAKAGEEEEEEPLPWTIATKYYRAELAVHVRHAGPGVEVEGVLGSSSFGGGEGEEGEGASPHGVILVVDGRRATDEDEEEDEGAGLAAWRPW